MFARRTGLFLVLFGIFGVLASLLCVLWLSCFSLFRRLSATCRVLLTPESPTYQGLWCDCSAGRIGHWAPLALIRCARWHWGAEGRKRARPRRRPLFFRWAASICRRRPLSLLLAMSPRWMGLLSFSYYCRWADSWILLRQGYGSLVLNAILFVLPLFGH